MFVNLIIRRELLTTVCLAIILMDFEIKALYFLFGLFMGIFLGSTAVHILYNSMIDKLTKGLCSEIKYATEKFELMYNDAKKDITALKLEVTNINPLDIFREVRKYMFGMK